MAAKKTESGIEIINSHIAQDAFANIYLMTGEEFYLVYQFRNKLLKALTDIEDNMNYMVFKGENAKPDNISEFALTMPFFADRRVLLIEHSDFFKKGNEEMEKVLEELPDTTVIIFVETNIDKRNRLYKLVQSKGVIAEFNKQDSATLMKWISRNFTDEDYEIENAALYKMLEAIGDDMNILSNEIEKLKNYCHDSKSITVAAVEEICISQVEGKIFDMMDALSKRDKETTIELYNDLLLLKEPPMRLLYLITRQYNLLLKAKLALKKDDNPSYIASVLKVPPFTVKKYINQSNAYSYEELLAKLDRCQDADTHIKTGKYSDKMSVELLIVELLQR